MNITRGFPTPSRRGPADWFTGTVWFDEIAAGNDAARVRALRVTFEPGARTAWHTHPHGQLLHIVAGVGRVQREGGPFAEVRAGDTVWFEPGERHWHGAAPGNLMVHLAIHRPDDQGEAATWFEHVSDEDYNRG
jgi:quercetin dioxygenase-like cupin family protein